MRLRGVDANGGIEGAGRTHILVHQACFADTAIAKNDDLEKEVLCQFGLDAKARLGVTRSCCGDRTLRRTFFRDAMGAVCVQGLGNTDGWPSSRYLRYKWSLSASRGRAKGKIKRSRGQEVKKSRGPQESWSWSWVAAGSNDA